MAAPKRLAEEAAPNRLGALAGAPKRLAEEAAPNRLGAEAGWEAKVKGEAVAPEAAPNRAAWRGGGRRGAAQTVQQVCPCHIIYKFIMRLGGQPSTGMAPRSEDRRCSQPGAARHLGWMLHQTGLRTMQRQMLQQRHGCRNEEDWCWDLWLAPGDVQH